MVRGLSRKNNVRKGFWENYPHENVNFFPKTLDSERRIIYNATINESSLKKFIMIGSGVARLNREAGWSPARSRHCNSQRPDIATVREHGKASESVRWSQETCLIGDFCLTRERRGRNLRRLIGIRIY